MRLKNEVSASKLLLTALITVFMFGCGSTKNKANQPWKTIKVGGYLFDFPADFELIKERGIDSYVGRIKGDSMQFLFDFGYYSNRLEQTPEEYVEKGAWRMNLGHRFMKSGVTYDQHSMPKVEIISIDQVTSEDRKKGIKCDYVVKCKYDTTKFEFALNLPQDIKQMNFAIDTLDNHYRKIVWSKDTKKGTTGGYFKELNSFNASINRSLALSISTSKLTQEQQIIALKILKTGRPIKQTK